jgi:ribokinase
MPGPRPLIIDTDPGIDDALALAMAFNAPGFFVPLVTTVAGNTGLDAATQNAALLLPLLGAPDGTVLAQGASKPLKRSIVDAEDFHGEDGLGGAQEMLLEANLGTKPVKKNAVSRLISAVRQYGNELTIVALGPLTNIARAVRREPELMAGIDRLVVMGGALRVAGNTTPASEFNFFADPHAADIVLRSGLPMTIVPLDATEQVRLTDAQLRKALGGRRDLLARTLRQMTRISMARHRREGIALHDPLAMAVAIRPTIAKTESVPVSVITTGALTAGMTLEDRRPYNTESAIGSRVDVVFTIDVPAAISCFVETALTSGVSPDALADEHVTVVGGANVDLVVRSRTLPHAGETVSGEDLLQADGGKGANQAVAARRAGAEVSFIGRVGRDRLGDRACAQLLNEGINISGVGRDRRPTGVALIAVDQHGQNQISVGAGANATLTPSMVKAQRARIAASRVLVCQFESPLNAVIEALTIARKAGVTTVLNASPVQALPPGMVELVDVLIVNEVEAEALVAQPVRTVPEVRRALDSLQALGFSRPIITLGRRGVMYREDARFGRVRGEAVTSVDATAAGDTFVGYVAAGLACGQTLAEAIKRANYAAAITVTRMGAQPSIPSREEVLAMES